MYNQTLNMTLVYCEQRYGMVYLVVNNVLLFFGFPSTLVIIVKLLSKIYKTRSVSPAEAFLLQINFTNVFLFSALLLLFLTLVQAFQVSAVLYMVFFIPSLTARPFFLLAICAIFYMAIAHPVTYMSTKTWLRWDWLVIALIWVYTLATNIAIILEKFDYSNPYFSIIFFINFPVTMFFNIATLRALYSSGPGNGAQSLNPAKKKAFRTILSIQLVLLVYYLPGIYVYFYGVSVPSDWNFVCYQMPMIMLLPRFSEFAMPAIFLYSLRKLGV